MSTRVYRNSKVCRVRDCVSQVHGVWCEQVGAGPAAGLVSAAWRVVRNVCDRGKQVEPMRCRPHDAQVQTAHSFSIKLPID